MSPVTHFLTGWALANSITLARRERALVTFAAVVPDLDRLGIVPELLTRNSAHPLLWFSHFHHLLHTLPFAVLVAALTFLIATERWKTGLLAFFAFHLHLLEDLAGSRGPDGLWSVPYLWPFSPVQWAWSGQWALNAWPNYVVTVAFLILTFYIAWKHCRSPLEMVSLQADKAFVGVVHARFAPPASRAQRAKVGN